MPASILPPRLAPPAGLAEAVAARVCHDLASPLGAVANGIELLALAGGGAGPELDLVTESADAATARLRLLRLAFGPAAGAPLPRADMAATLGAIRGERLSIEWLPAGPTPRPEARLAVLAILCLDAVLPRGGRIDVAWDERWRLRAAGTIVSSGHAGLTWLTGPAPSTALSATGVEFPLLRLGVEAVGRAVGVHVTAETATLDA